MPRPAFLRRAALLPFLLPVLSLLCLTAVHAQAVLHLQADSATLPAGSVLHLSVSSPFSSGTVTFLDGATPLASLPLGASGKASLGVATLTRGTHTLSATLAVSAGPGNPLQVAGNSVQVTVSGLPLAFTLSANPAQVLPGQALTLATLGLPADATGSVAFSDAGTGLNEKPLGSVAFAAPVSTYIAYGDGVTLGIGSPTAGQTYPGLFAADLGLTLIDRARPPFTTCDILPHQILDFADFGTQAGSSQTSPTQASPNQAGSNQAGPSQTVAPLTSLMPGANDTYDPHTLNTFTLCHQAALAWLAVPRESKTLAGDLAVQSTSGTWTPPSFTAPTGNPTDPVGHTLFNSTGSGSARIILTTDGSPIYLWYLLQNSNPGLFTLTLDGITLPGTYGLQAPDYLLSTFGAGSSGFALARLPAPAGAHTLDVTLLSGALGILGAGTPPGAAAASVHPTVLAADLPSENNTCAPATAATLAAFSAAVQANAAQLAGDGLDVRFIPTRAFMTGTPAEMADCTIPNPLGSRHLADALEAVLPAAAAGAYQVSPGTPLTLFTQLQSQGVHTLLASFPGDSRYAPGAATLAVTVQNPATSTSLTTPAVSLGFGTGVRLAATVTPTAGGSVRFTETTGTDIVQVDLDHGSAAALFTPPPGSHTYLAAYHSNDLHSDSVSQPVTVHVEGLASTLTVAASPQQVSYGQQIHLTASLSNTNCTGLLTFSDALAGPLGSLYVAQGTGAIDLPALPGGTHLVSVAYTGDPICTPQISAPVSVLVTPLPPSLMVTPLNQPTFPQAQVLQVDLLGYNLPAPAHAAWQLRPRPQQHLRLHGRLHHAVLAAACAQRRHRRADHHADAGPLRRRRTRPRLRARLHPGRHQ